MKVQLLIEINTLVKAEVKFQILYSSESKKLFILKGFKKWGGGGDNQLIVMLQYKPVS